ncbi:invasion protein CiaB [Campylobacter corcagiensis]|uniref:Invasion protein CiaB n=1 Tax=Campylobacter corcagiensis TaxID=1448857 RepID=A0A7M1LIK9_9BACT|nr:invasion protein CiaB [Campylobacter corcagiensis]QKF64109.1 invasion antigen B [Campylobacter corcagiensis]QOQ87696.1 invasion protein CiaB [Campylobacter corcagiensis]
MNNDYSKFLEFVEENRQKLNALYKDLDNDYVKKGLQICDFKGSKSEKMAVLRRIVDLKTDPLLIELKKKNLSKEKSIEIRDKMFKYTALIHENMHRNLVNKAMDFKVLSSFNLALINGIHKIGLIFNKLQPLWQQRVIDENSFKFKAMKNPYKFIKDNALYQKTSRGEISDRCYGVVKFINDKEAVLEPYAVAFPEFAKELERAFDELLDELKIYGVSQEELSYIRYLENLKYAILETNPDRVIDAWRDAEMAWMDTKGDIQIGHLLEYYEDAYTHVVALEWDVRLKENGDFDDLDFKKDVKKSFGKVYENIGANNSFMRSMVNSNIDKTQLYISTPALYYGADLEGLFSAQVVPNDEFVSANSGKKIFAFVKHVYEAAKSRPYMKIASEIFEKNYLDYGRDILNNKPEIWRKVYEISTIGHEFGHLWFIDDSTENSMNKSGVFKFIEEYKATTGGLINFFYNEKAELKKPVFDELIRRSVGLIAWQEVEHVRAYYCEGLIHLTLLFESGALNFNGKKLIVNLDAYPKFKDLTIKNYENLATHYTKKLDAAIFLDKFAVFEGDVYLPKDKKVREFVEYYHALYKEIGNEIDEDATNLA